MKFLRYISRFKKRNESLIKERNINRSCQDPCCKHYSQTLSYHRRVTGSGPREAGRLWTGRRAEAHIFKFDLPGLTKEDVKLQVHDGRVLHVSAVTVSREEEEENKDCKWYCRERVDAGSFRREFRLPENAVVDEIKASMSDGVLVVTVPKDESKKKKKHAKKRAVEIAGEGEEDSAVAKGLGRFVCCKA